MPSQNKWPNPPDEITGRTEEAWLEFYKAGLQQKIEEDKADHQNDLDIKKAREQNALDKDEADHQNDLDIKKAREQNTLDKDKADHQNDLDIKKAQEQNPLDKDKADYQNDLDIKKAKEQKTLDKDKADYQNNLDIKKAQEQKTLDNEKADHQNNLDIKKAQEQNTLDNEKADHQNNLDIKKAQEQNTLDKDKADYQNNLDLQKATYENHFAIMQAVHNGYIEVAKGEWDRSLQRADFVQKVAAAIGTVYAAIIALTYSVGSASGVPLPITGMAPAIFLGLSFFLSAFYVAGFSKWTHSDNIKLEPSGPLLPSEQDAQRNTFINWNNQGVLQRSEFLTASVVSLGIGVICLPLPYLSPKTILFGCVMGIGLFVLILTPVFECLLNRHASKSLSKARNPNIPPIPAAKVTFPRY